MRRYLCTFIILVTFGLANAQRPESYVGVGVTNFGVASIFPVLSVQLGGPVAEDLQARGVLDTILLGNMLSGDLLYTPELSHEVSLTLGAGPHFTLVTAAGGGGAGFGAHALVGGVYRLSGGAIGIFGELRPTVLYLASPTLHLDLRLGVNFYY